jgi:hypothetical protein
VDIGVHAALPSQTLQPVLHRTEAPHMQWLCVSTG